MKTLGIIAAVLALLVGGVVVWWKVNYTYTYRYRLTLAIEVDGKVHTGSSVIEVVWETGPGQSSFLGGVQPIVRGQGVFIDLGPRGAVVATFLTGERSEKPDGSQAAIWLAARAFDNKSTKKELPELERLQGRRDLTPDNMPRLIWFSDISDPKTARKFKVDDIPTLFGPGARLAAAYVEITRDPIVIDIDKKLPWYSMLASQQKARGVLSRPGEFQLIYSMFVGGGS